MFSELDDDVQEHTEVERGEDPTSGSESDSDISECERVPHVSKKQCEMERGIFPSFKNKNLKQLT